MRISKINNNFNKIQYKNQINPINFGLKFNAKGKDTFELSKTQRKNKPKKKTLYIENGTTLNKNLFSLNKKGKLFYEINGKNIPYSGTVENYIGGEINTSSFYFQGLKSAEKFYENGIAYKEVEYNVADDKFGSIPSSIVYYDYNIDKKGYPAYVISRNDGKDWLDSPEVQVQDRVNNKYICFITPNEVKGLSGSFEVSYFDKDKNTFLNPDYVYTKDEPDKYAIENKEKLSYLRDELLAFKNLIQENKEYKNAFGQSEKLNEYFDIVLNQMNSALEE